MPDDCVKTAKRIHLVSAHQCYSPLAMETCTPNMLAIFIEKSQKEARLELKFWSITFSTARGKRFGLLNLGSGGRGGALLKKAYLNSSSDMHFLN